MEILRFDWSDGDFTFGNGGGNGVGGDFDIVWFTFDSGTFELLFTFDGDFVGAEARDVSPHFINEFTESGDMGFAGSVIDDGGTRKISG